MVKNTIILIIALLTAAGCAAADSKKQLPRAINGVIDLRSWNVSDDGPVELSGQWKFCYGRHTAPGSNNKAVLPSAEIIKDDSCGYIPVPGKWNGFKVRGREIPGHGFGTYGLKILLREKSSMLTLKLLDIHSAGAVFINGRKMGYHGFPGKSGEETVPAGTPLLINFVPDSYEVNVLIHVSNFHHRLGGIISKAYLGDVNQVHRMRLRNITRDVLLFGILMFIGLYHGIVFFLRRQDRTPLYFAVYCILVGIFSILQGELYFFQLFPGSGMLLHSALIFLTFYLSVPVFAMFMHELFPGEFSKIALRIIQVLGVLFSAAVIILPISLYSYTDFVYQGVTFLICVYAVFVLFLALHRKRDGAGVFISGFMFLFVIYVNDILHDNRIIYTGYFISLGLVIFIMAQAYILARRSSRAFQAVKNLSNRLKDKTEELEEVNMTLEHRVRGRTEDLHAAMEEMEAMNESLSDTNEQLERTLATARQDMDMAVNVQKNFLPGTIPETDDWEVAFVFKPKSGVSGDFYDFYVINGRFAGLGLFDVSGHGIASGLITMLAKSIIFRNFEMGLDNDLGEVLRKANSELQDEFGDVDNFLSGVILRYSAGREDCLEYVNAGHVDIFHRSGQSVRPVLNESGESVSGYYLGLAQFSFPYEKMRIPVSEGDFILLFTDCLVEATDGSDKPFGEERVSEAFRTGPDGSAGLMLEYIMEKFNSYVKDRDALHDDLTVIVMKKR